MRHVCAGEGLPAESMAAASSWKGVKRFYTRVSVSPRPISSLSELPIGLRGRAAAADSAVASGWFQVLIDGRALRTNAMNELWIPTEALAWAIATEFANQGDTIYPASQPLYNLTCAAIDTYGVEDVEAAADQEAELRATRLAAFDEALAVRGLTGSADALIASAGSGSIMGAPEPQHANTQVTGRHASGAMTTSSVSGTGKLRDMMLDYLETDTVCYRIDVDMADPSEQLLRKRQDKYYAPLLAWWKESFGSDLGVALGFGEATHPDAAYMVAEDTVDRADPFYKAALASVVSASKSSVIALALLHRNIDVDTAFETSRVEEEFQIKEHGFVEDGHDTARIQTKVVLAAASALLYLSPGSAPSVPPSTSRKGYEALLASESSARAARVTARRAHEAELVAVKRALLRKKFMATQGEGKATMEQ